MGCGVGKPARNIASFSGANVVGLNYNDYQIGRCKFHTKNEGMEHLCRYVQVHFHNVFPTKAARKT